MASQKEQNKINQRTEMDAPAGKKLVIHSVIVPYISKFVRLNSKIKTVSFCWVLPTTATTLTATTFRAIFFARYRILMHMP